MVDNNVRTPVAQQLNNAFGQVNAAGAQGKGTQKTPSEPASTVERS